MQKNSKKNILVVDDDPLSLEIIAEFISLFRGDSVEVHTFTNPVEALRAARDIHFEIVFSDYRMPRLKGDHLIKELRKLSPSIQSVLVSSESNIEALALDSFCSHYIRKPFGMDEIKGILDQLMKAAGNP